VVWLKDIGVRTISLADTVGRASGAGCGRTFIAAQKPLFQASRLGCICTAVPDRAAEKCLLLTKRAAGD